MPSFHQPNEAMTYALRFAASLLLTAVLIAAGCTGEHFGGTKDDPLAAEIVDVKVEPNPVVVGDTANFTCVIDNSSSDLTYHWSVDKSVGRITTEVNSLEWIAPAEPDTLRHSVEVQGSGGRPDQQGFRVIVVPKDTSSSSP
jgi:hypothetical protein